MNTDPSKSFGFRPTQPFCTEAKPQPTLPDPSRRRNVVGWRLWIGPLLIARTPGIRPGIHVGWTR